MGSPGKEGERAQLLTVRKGSLRPGAADTWGQTISGMGPSWALGGVEKHPGPHPLSARSAPTSPNNKNVPRYHPGLPIPTPSPWQPQAHVLFADLPALGISQKWGHTPHGLVGLASVTEHRVWCVSGLQPSCWLSEVPVCGWIMSSLFSSWRVLVRLLLWAVGNSAAVNLCTRVSGRTCASSSLGNQT